MATPLNQPCLCIGSFNCPSPRRIEEFQRSPISTHSLSSCRAPVLEKRSSKRNGFSLNVASSSVHLFCNACRPSADSFGQNEVISGVPINRRAAATLLFLTILAPPEHPKLAMAADEEVKPTLNLETYTDEKEGFTILRPTQWNKIDKVGATVLFEDPQSKGNNIGVVVNPVRISSLNEFGTVDVVADKLLQAERRKPSTNDVQLIKVNERQVHGGAPLYLLEYKLDSSRGVKRILSAVTVASRKLYILNVAYADSLEKPLLADTASVLEKIANSFDVLD